jgi:hypothetical protein
MSRRGPLIARSPAELPQLPATFLLDLLREHVTLRSRLGEFVVYSTDGSGGIPLLVVSPASDGAVTVRPATVRERPIGKKAAVEGSRRARMAIARAETLAEGHSAEEVVAIFLGGVRDAVAALPTTDKPRSQPGGPSASLGNRSPVGGKAVRGGLPGLGKRR